MLMHDLVRRTTNSYDKFLREKFGEIARVVVLVRVCRLHDSPLEPGNTRRSELHLGSERSVDRETKTIYYT